MADFYLTPASVSYLTQSIMALAITAYLAHRSRLALHTPYGKHTTRLVGFFASITLPAAPDNGQGTV